MIVKFFGYRKEFVMEKPVNLYSPEQRRKFCRQLSDTGVQQVRYLISEDKYNEQEKAIVERWIQDSANGKTLEDDLLYISDQMNEIIASKNSRDQKSYFSQEECSDFEALYAEAQHLLTLGFGLRNIFCLRIAAEFKGAYSAGWASALNENNVMIISKTIRHLPY